MKIEELDIDVEDIDELEDIAEEILTDFCIELEKQEGMTRPVDEDDDCCNQWINCESCGNKGYLKIKSKEMEVPLVGNKIRIGDIFYNPEYIKVLHNVCATHEQEKIELHYSNPNRASVFNISDIKVLIMPCIVEKIEDEKIIDVAI